MSFSIAVKDRDERIRLVKDRQNEERQRKLEELKAQALAAQKYREQKEDERKRRIDEMRNKELDKRQQVGFFGKQGRRCGVESSLAMVSNHNDLSVLTFLGRRKKKINI